MSGRALPDLRSRPVLRRGALAALGLLVGLCYLLPQAFFMLGGHDGPVLIKADEPFYAARLTRVTQGNWTVGDPWTWEHRDEPPLIPPLPELTLAPLHRLGFSVDAIVLLSRFLLSALGALALALALRACGLSPWLAMFAAAWVFTDAGLMHYKPLVHILLGQEGLPFNRFSNPLFGLPLFFLAWGLGARAFLAERDHRRHAIGSGVLLGLLFFVSVYYWSHLALALLLTAVLLPSDRRLRVLAWGAGTAVVVSIPYWLMLAELQGHPVYPHIAWRNGLLVAERGTYLLPNKALWAFVLALVLLARGARPSERAIIAAALAGLICYFSPLVIGRSFQNFHWTYTTAPFLYVGVFALGARWARARPAAEQRRWVAAAAGALALSLGATAVSSWRQAQTLGQSREAGIGVADEGYGEAWAWLRTHAEPGSVVLASSTTQRVVPLRTGLRVWSDNGVELVSFQELLERNQVLWTVSGVGPDQLQRVLLPGNSHSVAQWSAGLPAETVDQLVAAGRPPFDAQRCEELAQLLVEAQQALTPAAVVRNARRYRVDYLVRGPNESEWGEHPERWLLLEPAVQLGAIRIERVRGWRDQPSKRR